MNYQTFSKTDKSSTHRRTKTTSTEPDEQQSDLKECNKWQTYSPFMNDLVFRIEEYNKTVKSKSEENRYCLRQREIWSTANRRKAITQETIGYDNENCLRLLTECGYDGEPVSTQTASTTRKWFELTNGHIFPPQIDVLRLAIFFCLDFYESLHFVLRSDFDRYLFENDPDWDYLHGCSYIDIIADYNTGIKADILADAIKKYEKCLDHEAHYRLFENQWRMASSEGYSQDRFTVLIGSFFENNLLCYENSSPKIAEFSSIQRKNIEISKFGSPEEQDTLWRSRCRWQLLLEDLDEYYVEIENTRLKNAETEQDYLRLFGKSLIEQTELEIDVRLLDMKIGLKRINPDMTEEELDKQTFDTQEKLQKDLTQMKLLEAIAQSQVSTAWSQMGIPMDQESLDDIKALCKKEIRMIRKLVHPDILMNNPEYQKLTDEQKKELEEILLDSLQISPSELGYPPNFAYHDMRSLEGLRQVRRRVEEILNIKNIHIELQYQIQGETILEQIEWLNREIRSLENQINAAKAQLTAMLTDSNTQTKKILIGNKEKQQDFRAQIEDRIAQLKTKRVELKVKLSLMNFIKPEGRPLC